jgi:hypothetical protein
MNYLGVPMIFQISKTTNSVTMNLPSIGFTRSYDGSRDVVLAKLKQDIKDNFDLLQKSLISQTPNSIVAGNPNSLQSQTVGDQFSAGFSGPTSTLVGGSSSSSGGSGGTGGPSARQSINNLRGIGLGLGRFKQNGVKSQSSTIPLSYAWRFDDDERRQVVFSLPLTGGQIENSKIYSAQAGLGIGIPISPAWTLTPAIGYGITGSKDLLQASQQVSISLTSAYTIPLDDGYLLSFGNMLGYYSTVKLQIKDYQNLSGLQNTVLRNGVLFAVPLPQQSFLGEGLAVELSAINTRFLGSSLYIDSTNEFGFTVGTDKRARGIKRYLRVGLSYLSAKNSNGISANFGFWF